MHGRFLKSRRCQYNLRITCHISLSSIESFRLSGAQAITVTSATCMRISSMMCINIYAEGKKEEKKKTKRRNEWKTSMNGASSLQRIIIKSIERERKRVLCERKFFIFQIIWWILIPFSSSRHHLRNLWWTYCARSHIRTQFEYNSSKRAIKLWDLSMFSGNNGALIILVNCITSQFIIKFLLIFFFNYKDLQFVDN